MAKEPKKLEDLFEDGPKDIYYAEKKILTALPKMATAQNDEPCGRRGNRRSAF
jgi:ferritin-like metal-binding protein YciE